jgi:hypothetical protein
VSLSYEDAIVAPKEQLHDSYDEEGCHLFGDLIESKFEHMHEDEELWFDAP